MRKSIQNVEAEYEQCRGRHDIQDDQVPRFDLGLWSRAEDELARALGSLVGGHWGSAISDAYFAMLHASQYFLTARGIRTRKFYNLRVALACHLREEPWPELLSALDQAKDESGEDRVLGEGDRERLARQLVEKAGRFITALKQVGTTEGGS